MKSSNLPYIPQIDQLRFLAAFLVFAFHFFHIYRGNWVAYPQHPWFGLITEGHTGVALFFVLSGFIFMTIALGSEEIDYKRFLRNRILRIAPLFLVVYVVAISVNRDSFTAADLLYVFVTNVGDPPTSRHIITGPAWSISVEFAFYLVFPFLALFTRQQGVSYLLKLIAMLLVIKLATYVATEKSMHVLYSTLVGRFDQFLIGMIAAIAYARRDRWLAGKARLLLLASAILTLIAIGIQTRYASNFLPDQKQPFWIIWPTIEATCWAAVIVGYLSSGVSFGAGLGGLLARWGAWSFSIYMWHALILFTAFQIFGPVGGTGFVALTFNGIALWAATLAFSWLSYTLIEQPFLAMRGRYVGATPVVPR